MHPTTRTSKEELTIDVGILMISTIMHGCNLFFMIKYNLNQPRYRLLLNLTVSGILVILNIFIRLMLPRSIKEELLVLEKILYDSSLITTMLISLDQYIAIKHCLRYNQIVSKKNLLMAIIVPWLLSILLKLLPLIHVTKVMDIAKRYINTFQIVEYAIWFGCSITLITFSIEMKRVRKEHIDSIKKQSIHSMVEREKLGKLKDLKNSIKDVFRLNIATAVIVIGHASASLCSFYGLSKHFNTIAHIMATIYFFTNPFLYALTMSELRTYYYKYIRYILSKFCIIRISPDETINEPAIVHIY